MGSGGYVRRRGGMLAGCASVTAASMTLAALSGCGPPSSTSSTSTPTATMTTPPVDPDVPAGRLDPGALVGFSCRPDESGGWTATGTLTNTGSDAAAYVLTVVVAGPDSTATQAKRQVVALRSGASAPVEITALPMPAEGELTCQVQVVRRA